MKAAPPRPIKLELTKYPSREQFWLRQKAELTPIGSLWTNNKGENVKINERYFNAFYVSNNLGNDYTIKFPEFFKDYKPLFPPPIKTAKARCKTLKHSR